MGTARDSRVLHLTVLSSMCLAAAHAVGTQHREGDGALAGDASSSLCPLGAQPAAKATSAPRQHSTHLPAPKRHRAWHHRHAAGHGIADTLQGTASLTRHRAWHHRHAAGHGVTDMLQGMASPACHRARHHQHATGHGITDMTQGTASLTRRRARHHGHAAGHGITNTLQGMASRTRCRARRHQHAAGHGIADTPQGTASPALGHPEPAWELR